MRNCASSLVFAALAFTHSASSFAYDWSVETAVTLVQPTYMPRSVSFKLSDAAGECVAGAWLKWTPQGTTEAEKHANANAVYGTLLTAFITGRKVRVFGVNAGCNVEYLHMY